MKTIPTGRFVWFEYVSNEDTKAQGFFGELFGWKTKATPMPQGTYTMIALGDSSIGGYVKPPPEASGHAHWLAHLQVTSARDTANKVTSLGGKVTKQPFKLGEAGTMAVVTDPLGGGFALWQPAKPEDAGGDYKGTDGSWIWNELYTLDPDRSVAFYKAIGGFEVETMKTDSGPGPSRYEILKADGKGQAGVMKMPGVPQMWMPYVKVADADATVARAKKLGATFRMEAETIPNVGRLAVLLDPQGAPLGILKPSPT